MKRILSLLLLLSVTALYSQEKITQDLVLVKKKKPAKKKQIAFRPKYNTSLSFESKDKSFSTRMGGRIMVDHAVLFENRDLENNFSTEQASSATAFRRIFLFTSGVLYDNVHYMIQTDLTNGRVALRDAYLGLNDLPVIGNIRVGQMKEPFRFESLNSSNYLTFLERSLGHTFIPLRNNGVLLFNEFAENNLGAQLGFFRNASGTTGNDEEANGGYAITGRVNGNPYQNEEKNQCLHLGLAYTYRKPKTDSYRIRTIPEANLSLINYIDTGDITNVNQVKMINGELVLRGGPFTVQSEYTYGEVNTDILDYNFNTYYGQVSYMLTGEHKKLHTFYDGYARLKPTNNYGKDGFGAWELAARVSQSDLNTINVNGGEQMNYTFGVNWYLNPLTKFMFNYVNAQVKDLGSLNVLQFRAQVNF